MLSDLRKSTNSRISNQANGNGSKGAAALASKQAKQMAWLRENLYVPAVCDILDELGYRQQAMHQRLRPLDPKQSVIVGRARTFRWMTTDYVVEKDPYGLEIEAMDSLKAGDVVIHST